MLVADDCPFNVFAMQSLLVQLNVDADFCSNGEDAIQSVMQRDQSGSPMYKLILLDYSMPVCDGPKATRKIRAFLTKKGYSSQDQPIICFVTAYQEDQKQKAAQEAGVDLYLVKPVFKNHLHKVLIKAKLIS